MVVARELRLPALRITQGSERTLFAFAVDGKLVQDFAAVSRMKRGDEGNVLGYQRPEVRSHIAEIRRYLESPNPMIPNAIVVAFDSRVRFEELDNKRDGHGTLIVPLADSPEDSDRAAWVVDGQQRLAAIREATVAGFPICVIGFIARDDQEQREQFMLVNSSKPLPKGLIYELLPNTEGNLPSALERRRFPAKLLDRLNRDDDSPLRGMVRTPTTPGGVIQDNSMLRMLEHSLSDGVLYRLKQEATPEDQPLDTMLGVVKRFWEATASVFREAWHLPPKRSRLTHGAGVVSMGFVMDAIAERHRPKHLPAEQEFRSDLEGIRDVCRWTDGYWDFGPGMQRKWNEIQNTPNDIQLLSNYLLMQYKARVWARPA
ncbi:MAG: DGQHR domain-containing protein DpdB [Gemmatimonadales bacterium]